MIGRARRAFGRLPLVAWLVVLVALLHGAGWAVLTPNFQGIDETVHVGYIEYIAEHGTPPKERPDGIGLVPSRQSQAALSALKWTVIARPSWSRAGSTDLQRTLDQVDDDRANRFSDLGAGYQAPNPPLYDYLAVVPYKLAGALGATLTGQMLAVRLLSVAIGGLCVLFVVLFLRELLPRHPLSWAVGGAAVALQPVFGWTIGSVNNDLPVWCAGAALLWLATRMFRRGLTTRLAVALGVTVLVALLSKVSAIGLLAGLAWMLFWYAVSRRHAWRAVVPRAALALGIVVVPWRLLAALRPLEVVDGNGNPIVPTPGPPLHPAELLSYLWQFWLPKLSFMTDQFQGYPQYPLWETYLQAFAGRFGWFQYGFSEATIWRVTIVVGVALLLALGALALRWRRVVAEWPLVVALVGGFVGFALMVNVAGYSYVKDTAQNFEQVRYLFPYIGIYGLVFAVALLAFPARWRRPVAAGLIALAALHVGASWALTLSRYYM